jgi:hypothetical protein
MNVLDGEAATNFQLSPGKTCGKGISHSRFKKLNAGLDICNDMSYSKVHHFKD